MQEMQSDLPSCFRLLNFTDPGRTYRDRGHSPEIRDCSRYELRIQAPAGRFAQARHALIPTKKSRADPALFILHLYSEITSLVDDVPHVVDVGATNV